MSKKGIFLIAGAVALGGAALWYFWPTSAGKSASSSSGSAASSTDTSSASTDTSTASSDTTDTGLSDLGGMGLDKSKKQVRKDCRLEARIKCGTGLKHLKCRRMERAKCKLAGGVDNGEADFAFNGHTF